MDKNGSVIVLFVLFIIVFGQSDAFNPRKLATNSDPNGTSNANQDASLSSPPPPDIKTNTSAVEAPKPKDIPVTSPPDLESKGLNDAHTKKGSEDSSDKKPDDVKNQDGKGSKTLADQNCKKNQICSDHGKTISACVQDSENGSNNLTVIVQNEQDVPSKVNITVGTSINSYLPPFDIPPHGIEKVNITFSGDKSNKVILNAGNGDCELQISQPSPVNSPPKPKDVQNLPDSPTKPKDVDPPLKSKDTDDPSKSKNADDPSKSKGADDPSKSKGADDPSKSKDVDDQSKSKEVDSPPKSKEVDDPSKSKEIDDPSRSKDAGDPSKPKSKNKILDQLTFYSKQVTPIHGAYLAFLLALVIGASWALCSFRKRRTSGGVAYQELEMGPAESSNAAEVETAEGWEQDWDDDDWDEDKAIRSPGGSLNAKTISSNGLTSRAGKKDSWDADWDD